MSIPIWNICRGGKHLVKREANRLRVEKVIKADAREY